jgi:hypothetical protein
MTKIDKTTLAAVELLPSLDNSVVHTKGERVNSIEKRKPNWRSYIPKFFTPKPAVKKERTPSTIASDRYQQEKELVYSLLPATKKQLTAKTGLSNRRLEIALRGTWYVHGVYEVPKVTG